MDLDTLIKVLDYIKKQVTEIVKLVWNYKSDEPKNKRQQSAERFHNLSDNIMSLLLCCILLSLAFLGAVEWILSISIKIIIGGKVIKEEPFIKTFLFGLPLYYQIVLTILSIALFVAVLRLLVWLVKFIKSYHVTSFLSLILILFWLVGVVNLAFSGKRPSEILRDHGIKLLLKTLGVEEIEGGG